MIDTHLHILPGIDDGPETLQESLALAEVLVQEAIHMCLSHGGDATCNNHQ